MTHNRLIGQALQGALQQAVSKLGGNEEALEEASDISLLQSSGGTGRLLENERKKISVIRGLTRSYMEEERPALAALEARN